jgi:hypothetical protein
MKWIKPKKSFRYWWSLAIVVIIVGMVSFTYIIQFPETKQNYTILQTAIQAITPPPQATPQSCSGFYKTDRTLVECFFETDLTHDQIESFYSEELSVQGWLYTGSHAVPDTPNDLKPAHYCKENYTAGLDYLPNIKPYTYVFSMSWSWGPHHCRGLNPTDTP